MIYEDVEIIGMPSWFLEGYQAPLIENLIRVNLIVTSACLLNLLLEVNAALVLALFRGWIHAGPQAQVPTQLHCSRNLAWKSFPGGRLELRPGTYHIFAEITEVVVSYKHGYYLPIFLKIYTLRWIENKQVNALPQSQVKKITKY